MNYAVPISEWNKLVEEKIDLQEKLKAANKVIEGQNGQMMTLQTQFESLTSQLKIAREALESIKVAKCENPEECCHWGLSIMAQSALQKISEVGSG